VIRRARGRAVQVPRATHLARHRSDRAAHRQTDVGPQRSWFSPEQATFSDVTAAGYPDSMGGVPDPLDLIVLTDSHDKSWLALVSRPDWRETQLPELEVMRPPRRTIWMHIDACLVPQAKWRHSPTGRRTRTGSGGGCLTRPTSTTFSSAPSWMIRCGKSRPTGTRPGATAMAANTGKSVPLRRLVGRNRHVPRRVGDDRGYVPSRPLATLLALAKGRTSSGPIERESPSTIRHCVPADPAPSSCDETW
jgi:hypothetical protein